VHVAGGGVRIRTLSPPRHHYPPESLTRDGAHGLKQGRPGYGSKLPRSGLEGLIDTGVGPMAAG
jgi:hypothetical protein